MEKKIKPLTKWKLSSNRGKKIRKNKETGNGQKRTDTKAQRSMQRTYSEGEHNSVQIAPQRGVA